MTKPEIEKKFLPGRLPAEIFALPGVEIRQGYLAVERPRQIRVRHILDRTAGASDAVESWFLAVKDESASGRMETEIPISAGQFSELWPLTGTMRIEKERARIREAGAVFEIDFYRGRHEGLCVVEVEFPDAEAAANFVPPEWLGEEVTGRREFSNIALALAPGRLDT